MPDTQHILHPTSTRSSLNFYGNPSGPPLHENVNGSDLSCPLDAGQLLGDYISTSDADGRVKLRFTPPILDAGNTFYGIVCNACGALTSPVVLQGGVGTLDHEEITVIGELFLDEIRFKPNIINLPFQIILFLKLKLVVGDYFYRQQSAG